MLTEARTLKLLFLSIINDFVKNSSYEMWTKQSLTINIRLSERLLSCQTSSVIQYRFLVLFIKFVYRYVFYSGKIKVQSHEMNTNLSSLIILKNNNFNVRASVSIVMYLVFIKQRYTSIFL
jgi:hypothetical protein